MANRKVGHFCCGLKIFTSAKPQFNLGKKEGRY
jgi:hypothetical protein